MSRRNTTTETSLLCGKRRRYEIAGIGSGVGWPGKTNHGTSMTSRVTLSGGLTVYLAAFSMVCSFSSGQRQQVVDNVGSSDVAGSLAGWGGRDIAGSMDLMMSVALLTGSILMSIDDSTESPSFLDGRQNVVALAALVRRYASLTALTVKLALNSGAKLLTSNRVTDPRWWELTLRPACSQQLCAILPTTTHHHSVSLFSYPSLALVRHSRSPTLRRYPHLLSQTVIELRKRTLPYFVELPNTT